VAFHDRLDYRPRPAFLGINAHTAKLARLNAEFIKSERGPHWLLFEIEPEGQRVNNRYPGSVEAPGMLETLANYQLVRTVANSAVMQRRSPRNYRLVPLTSHQLSFDETLRLSEHRLIWAQMRIDRSWLGAALDFVYKIPHVVLDITTASGRRLEYQLLPDVASAGFVLSPFLNSTDDFKAVATDAVDRLDHVDSMRVRVDGPAAMYARRIGVELSWLDFAGAPPPADPLILEHLRRLAAKVGPCQFSPEIQWDERAHVNVLVAHAPCEIADDVTGQRLHLRFGLRDGIPAGDGAEFQVVQEGRVLWSADVLPGTGEHQAEVTVRPGKILLKTLPGRRAGSTNVYDHTYWSLVEER
jgi:hypothetical protein